MTDTGEKEVDLSYMPAVELLDLFEWRTVSPVEVTKAVFERIASVEDAVNAFSRLNEEAALEAAEQSEKRWLAGEARGLVDGIPVTVKDIVYCKDWPIQRGSKAMPDDVLPEEDSPAVARLREHGAVIIGRTTTPEFGWKGVTDSPLTGVTRNPWNLNKTPGGSSGGAAAAAALGMGALHVGTDGGGSVRIPAGFTGIFGFKPSFGRVPVYPVSAFGTLSHIGPMTRTVGDAALMMNVMIEPDSRDIASLPYDPWDYTAGLELGVRHLTMGFSPNLGYVDVDGEVADLVASAVKVFEDLGAQVEAASPGFKNPSECFKRHWYTGARRMAGQYSDAERAEMDPEFLEITAEAEAYSLDDYLDAVDERNVLTATMNRFHDRFDLLLTPTLPIPAFNAGEPVADAVGQERWADWTPFTYPFNLTGQPACSVPCGFTSEGLPVGLQIVGPRHADPLVMRAAAAFEGARPFKMPGSPKDG